MAEGSGLDDLRAILVDHPVAVSLVGGVAIEAPTDWKTSNYRSAKELERLIFGVPAIMQFLLKHPADVVNGENFDL